MGAVGQVLRKVGDRIVKKIKKRKHLNELPPDTVILDNATWAYQKHSDPWMNMWIPAALQDNLEDDCWVPELPARVLWIPES